ncbi:MAG: hydrolase [Candidatus Saccharibacteria bacterium]|nr:hydrolase [Candidatus Saccharibacteria bacterium]
MENVIPSPFYRVSVKALIFDNQKRLLVFQDSEGKYEMPGGGWEHGESLDECITRELKEEMLIVPGTIGAVQFVYSGQHEKGYHKMCVAVPVVPVSYEFVPNGDGLVAARFVTREEFLQIRFQVNEQAVRDYVDQIWPES